jgi:hypothetical protein
MKDKKLTAYFSKLGLKSAKARMKKLTAEQRSGIASKAAKARWGKRKPAGRNRHV